MGFFFKKFSVTIFFSNKSKDIANREIPSFLYLIFISIFSSSSLYSFVIIFTFLVSRFIFSFSFFSIFILFIDIIFSSFILLF